MRPFAPLLTILLVATFQLSAQAALADDGPYVLWEGTHAKVLRFHEGKPRETALAAPYHLELEGLPPLRLDPAPRAAAQAQFPQARKLAAVSDVHGNFAGLVKLLAAQGVIGKDLRWTFGQGRLMVVGDMFDRGAQVTEVLWLVRSLEDQARAAGGGVHALLGNHEAMVLQGDLRYANAKYRSLPYNLPWLFSPDTELGRWLRSLPVMARVGDVLFTHGGPSPAFAAAHGDLQAVNAAARLELAGAKGEVLDDGGPLWYRGLEPAGRGHQATDGEVDAILGAYKAKAIVVGHTTLERVTPFHGARVYGIDAGLMEDRPGELWMQLDGKRFRGLADGTRVSLP